MFTYNIVITGYKEIDEPKACCLYFSFTCVLATLEHPLIKTYTAGLPRRGCLCGHLRLWQKCGRHILRAGLHSSSELHLLLQARKSASPLSPENQGLSIPILRFCPVRRTRPELSRQYRIHLQHSHTVWRNGWSPAYLNRYVPTGNRLSKAPVSLHI